VFNGERHLEQALRSLVDQTFPDLEILVSDNASTDRTWEICQDFAATHRCIRLLRNPTNLGASANYNLLVAQARGNYFKWAAHDDNCRPTFIAECAGLLDAEPAAVLCYPSTLIIDDAGRVLSRYRDRLHIDAPAPADRLRLYLRRNFLGQHGMCNPIFGLVRVELLRRTRLIQNFIGSDRTLLAHLALLGRIVETPSYLFERRIHARTSTMANRHSSTLTAWFSGESAPPSTPLPRLNNYLGLRITQLRDIARAVDELIDDPAVKRRCQRAFWGELVKNPKWMYRDVKYSLGLRPSAGAIVRSLGGP
jgi:glycosyltransferase involved in cell wall biosynthesis